MVINQCKICGVSFKHKRRSHQTCSDECFRKLASVLKIGELNPRFNNGWRQYHRITKDITICQKCSTSDKLETHHIDGNHKNNAPSNLKKTCRRCHMTLDGRIKSFNKFWNSKECQRPSLSEETKRKMSIVRKAWWDARRGGDKNGGDS